MALFPKRIFATIAKQIANVNPSTLTGVAIFTAWLGAGLMIPATVKAVKKKEEEKPEGVWDTVKCVAPCYALPAVALGVSTGCSIGSNNIHLRQNATLATAAAVAEQGLIGYKELVADTVDDQTLKQINKKEAVQTIKTNPPHLENTKPAAGNEITEFGAPKAICMDAYTKRYFWFAPSEFEKIEDEITRSLVSWDEYRFVNLMVLFGLDPIADDTIGWTSEQFMGWDGEVKFKFDLDTAFAPDGRPVIVVDYIHAPTKLNA